MAKRSGEIPKFLVSRLYISAVITLIVIFSMFFMVVYEPFSLAVWFSTSNIFHFSLTILFYVAAIFILVTSRTLMYILQDRIELNFMNYMWWLMSENLAISLLYTFITIRYFSSEGSSVPEIAVRALLCVTLILAIPNAIVSFYASYRSRCEELEAAQYELRRVRSENRMLREASEQTLLAAMQRRPDGSRMPKMVHLYDYGGNLRLTVALDALYYFQSEDNYVNVYYKYNDKIQSYMLRCKTGDLERNLQDVGMVRCHRSYIINIHKIATISEEHRIHYVILDDESIKRIPVSKRYYDALLERIDNKG